LPDIWDFNAFILGKEARQGEHHVAQKSTTTTFPFSSGQLGRRPPFNVVTSRTGRREPTGSGGFAAAFEGVAWELPAKTLGIVSRNDNAKAATFFMGAV